MRQRMRRDGTTDTRQTRHATRHGTRGGHQAWGGEEHGSHRGRASPVGSMRARQGYDLLLWHVHRRTRERGAMAWAMRGRHGSRRGNTNKRRRQRRVQYTLSKRPSTLHLVRWPALYVRTLDRTPPRHCSLDCGVWSLVWTPNCK
jgi:hypothetical protein